MVAMIGKLEGETKSIEYKDARREAAYSAFVLHGPRHLIKAPSKFTTSIVIYSLSEHSSFSKEQSFKIQQLVNLNHNT